MEGNASTNGDGFGLGWYDAQDREPGLYREVRPAWSDENLRHLCRHIRSHLFFAHVRASTGTPTTRPNCHPFAFGKWLFMHNGQVGDWSLIRRRVEALIPDELYKAASARPNSEAVFLAILGAGAETDPIAATHAHARRPHRHGAGERHDRAAALHLGAGGRREPLRVPLFQQRHAEHALLPRSRATTSWWCRSRSTPTARTGSWCRSAT